MEHTWLTVDELATALKVNPSRFAELTARVRFPWIDSVVLCGSTWSV
jgi:hypothetical protein